MLAITCGSDSEECPGSTSVAIHVETCQRLNDVYVVYGTATFPGGTVLRLGMANEERAGTPGVLGTFAIYDYPSAGRIASYGGTGGMSATGSGGRVTFTYDGMKLTSLNNLNSYPIVGEVSGTVLADNCQTPGG